MPANQESRVDLAASTPESVRRNDPLSALAIRILVDAGHVSQAAADSAFTLACEAMEDEAQRMNVELPWVVRKAAVPEAVHPDDLAVDRFAADMKSKLAASRAKGRSGWDDPNQCTVEQLARLLVDHIPKGDPVDVANFAMMLHQRGADHSVLAVATPEPVGLREALHKIAYEAVGLREVVVIARDALAAAQPKGGMA